MFLWTSALDQHRSLYEIYRPQAVRKTHAPPGANDLSPARRKHRYAHAGKVARSWTQLVEMRGGCERPLIDELDIYRVNGGLYYHTH